MEMETETETETETMTRRRWKTVLDPDEEAKVAAEFPTPSDFYRSTERIHRMVDADMYYYLYRVWCTSWQMLEDRGYEINVKEYDIPFHVFKDKYFKIKNNKRHPDRQKLQIRIHNPKVIVRFPGRARLEPPTLPIPVAEFMNDGGDSERCRIIVVLDMPPTKEESITEYLQGFYKVNYPPSVTTEVFASCDLFFNVARYDITMRRFKMVTAEEEEELKFIKLGKRKIQIKEEESSEGSGKRRKNINPLQVKIHIEEEKSSNGPGKSLKNINPRQVVPLGKESSLGQYFALEKGQFVKSSRPSHLNDVRKAESDAAEAKDPENARKLKAIKDYYKCPDEFQVVYYYSV